MIVCVLVLYYRYKIVNNTTFVLYLKLLIPQDLCDEIFATFSYCDAKKGLDKMHVSYIRH